MVQQDFAVFFPGRFYLSLICLLVVFTLKTLDIVEGSYTMTTERLNAIRRIETHNWNANIGYECLTRWKTHQVETHRVKTKKIIKKREKIKNVLDKTIFEYETAIQVRRLFNFITFFCIILIK